MLNVNKKQEFEQISIKKYLAIILLLLSFTANSQIKKTFQIISDTTKIVGIDSSGNQLILKNGTENRKNAFLKNKLGGITEFNYAVDSVWVDNDTLYVQRAILHKFKLNSTNNSQQNIFTNGLVISNDTIRHGGNLNTNTSINLNYNNYTIKQDPANYTEFSPSIFSSRRVGTNTKTLFEQRDAYFLSTVSNNNIIQSQLLLNDTISTLKYKNTAITLNDQKVVYNAKQHYFDGDWLKVPEKTQTQLDSLSLFRPAGSLIYNKTTKGLYVSDGDKMTPSAIEYLDGSEIQTATPVAWAKNNGKSVPLLRIRHPNNTTGLNNSPSIDQDFKIIPYQYGMAIEYNGVLENWVGEFSIHKGVNYADRGDGGNGWGAIFWVGDDNDYGGLRMTARNNTNAGGNIKWTEISSEQFNSASAGNIRLRLVDSTDKIDFVTGTRGSTNVYGFIGTSGIKFPSTYNINTILNPLKGLTVFDNSDSTLKVYNGLDWNGMNNSNLIVGKSGIKFPAVSSLTTISTPLKGLTVFDNSDSTLKVYNGLNWNGMNNSNLIVGKSGIKFPAVSNVTSIATPLKGLTVFDDSDSTMKVYNGLNWNGLNNSNLMVGKSGIKFPAVSNVTTITTPLKGLTVFDNSDSTMKVYNGLNWNGMNNSNLIVGKSGIKFPAVSNVTSIATPLKGLTVFDDSDSTMKVYNGLNWNGMNNSNLIVGKSGIKFPAVSSLTTISTPLKGLTVFDNSDSTLKVYNGLDWNGMNNSNLIVGKSGIKFPAVSNVTTITTPLKGLTVFDNSDSSLKVYNGLSWNVLNVNNRFGADTIKINTTFTDLTKEVQYVNASNGNVIITLPPISNKLSGLIFKVIKTDNSSNSVKIIRNGLNSINGVIFKEIQNQYECMNLYSNGINEWIATKESSY